MFRHTLSRDRAVEYPAHAASVKIGGGDAETTIRRAKTSVTTMTE